MKNENIMSSVDCCWFLFFCVANNGKVFNIQHAKFPCQMSWNSNNKNNKKYSKKTASDPRLVSSGIGLCKFRLFFPRFLIMHRGGTLIKQVYILISGVTSFFVGPKNKAPIVGYLLPLQKCTVHIQMAWKKNLLWKIALSFFLRWTVFCVFLEGKLKCNSRYYQL